jgi:guanine nucleotide-binding protein subunit beta
MMIMQWDLTTKTKIKSLDGHNGDIAALSLKPQDNQVFLTGSVDRTMRLWDLRSDKCQQTFWGHEADVNSLSFHPNGNNFVTCSEDKTSRLWDLRSDQEICVYKPPTPNSSFTSTATSASGRLLFCSSDDSTIHTWDVISKEHLGNMCGHENRITQISVAPSGIGIASSSWDFAVKCWGL